MEILFTRPVTEDKATTLKLVKCDTGITISLESIDFIHPKNNVENYHFIETERLDEFIGILNYIKSTL